jgi:hypothetical protein
MFVEARGDAETAADAVAQLAPLAAPHLQLLSTVANAAVDDSDWLLVYAPPTATATGQFVEQRACGSPALPAAAVRSVEGHEFIEVLDALNEHPEQERLYRAMAHFREALRSIDPLNRVMSAESLYMACENLGQVVFRRLCRQAGLPANGDTKHQFAVADGFVPKGTTRQHLYDFDSHLRVAHIFGGDRALYNNLRSASDAFEHGSASFGAVQRAADESADTSFSHIRGAILREIGVSATSSLLGKKYQHHLAGWQPKIELTGTFTDDTRPEGWPYFYGSSVFPEIVTIKDGTDDKREVTLRATANTTSLLEGQALTVEGTAWLLPSTPDRSPARVAEPQVVVTRGES